MKKILISLVILFSFSSCAKIDFKEEVATKTPQITQTKKVAISEEFVRGTEDVPLLLGMKKVSQDSLDFDLGRMNIASSSYDLDAEPAKIRKFYLETLPQMGWSLRKKDVANDDLSFVRDEEELRIEISKQSGKSLVRFSISAKNSN